MTTGRRSGEADRVLPHIPESAAHVLDCACGDGALGCLLKARGTVEVVGVEEDPALAEQAASVLDRVFTGNIESLDLAFDAGDFDCIVCTGVLARLRDPDAWLPKPVSWLSADGVLVASVPNVQFIETVLMLAKGRWTYGEGGALDRRNLRFFTAYEFLRLLDRAHLKVTQLLGVDNIDRESVPRDAEGYVTVGRVTIGPLNDKEYASYRVREYLALASRARGEQDAF